MIEQEPQEGWDEYARRNPDAPLGQQGAELYLGHLIQQHNTHVERMQCRATWDALPWYKRLAFWRAP